MLSFTYIRSFFFFLMFLRMISKNNLSWRFLIFSNININEDLFQTRHLFEMDCQVDKNEHHLFVFNQGHEAAGEICDI